MALDSHDGSLIIADAGTSSIRRFSFTKSILLFFFFFRFI